MIRFSTRALQKKEGHTKVWVKALRDTFLPKLVGKYIIKVPLECKSPPKDLTSDSFSSYKAHLRVPKGKRELLSLSLSF